MLWAFFLLFILRLSVGRSSKQERPHPPLQISSFIDSLGGLPTLDWQSGNALCQTAIKAAIKASPGTAANLSTSDPNFQCANLTIPYDYLESEVGQTQMALIRYRKGGFKTSARSFVLFNPCGPSQSGLTYLASNAEYFAEVVGIHQANHTIDLVSWDARAVGNLQPSVTCHKNATDLAEWFYGTPSVLHLPVASKQDAQSALKHNRNVFETTVQDDLLRQLQIGATEATTLRKNGCHRYSEDPNYFPYLGTYFQAMDIEYIRRIYTHQEELENKKLNYWGVSYGTAFGNQYVTMFPDHSGKVVLDGVLNPSLLFSRPYFVAQPYSYGSNQDDAIVDFYAQCLSVGQSRCALAADGETIEELDQKVFQAFNEIYENSPTADGVISNTSISRGIVYPQHILAVLWSTLESPALGGAYATAGKGLHELVQRNYTGVYNLMLASALTKTTASDFDVRSTMLSTAVACLDSVTNIDLEAPDKVAKVMGKVAYGLSRYIPVHKFLWCPQLGFSNPAARWSSTFGNKHLETPILVIGNRLDPITGNKGAKQVVQDYGMSATLVIHPGVGHTSLAQPSNCTKGILQRYFERGEMPKESFSCGQEGLWPLFAQDSPISYT